MPAVPVVVAVAASYGAEYAAADVIGTEILGSTLLADVATGAIAGAAAGEAGSIASGQGFSTDAAVKGAEGGAVSAGLFGTPVDPKGGLIPQLDTGFSSVNAGITGAEKGATSALVQGKGVGGALTQGAISGAVSAIGNEIQPTTDSPAFNNIAGGVEEGLLSSEFQNIFNPQSTAQPQSQPSIGAPSDPTQGQPGSAALAQALNTGGGGGPLFGSSSDQKDKPVWNLSSLRTKDDSGASNG